MNYDIVRNIILIPMFFLLVRLFYIMKSKRKKPLYIEVDLFFCIGLGIALSFLLFSIPFENVFFKNGNFDFVVKYKYPAKSVLKVVDKNETSFLIFNESGSQVDFLYKKGDKYMIPAFNSLQTSASSFYNGNTISIVQSKDSAIIIITGLENMEVLDEEKNEFVSTHLYDMNIYYQTFDKAEDYLISIDNRDLIIKKTSFFKEVYEIKE